MNVEEKKENASNQNEENSNMKFEKKPETVEEKLQAKIEEQKEEIDEKDDRIKRLMAEFENFKKRSDKERLGMYNSVMGDVVMKLLPVLDNLEKAVAAESKDEQYKNGIEMVEKQFQDVLKANGVKEIESIGKPFDPSLHEAVSLVEDSNLGPKTIKEEYRKGYTIGDKVLRHSLVVVAN
jgi:molecular chaperone GrpE